MRKIFTTKEKPLSLKNPLYCVLIVKFIFENHILVQKAFIEVNEEGTEAAAATGVIMKTAMIPKVKKKFVLNRPFLYFIRDHKTSVTLFNGRVMNPKN